MKRLIVCCDGTWQSQDNDVPTNVLKIAQSIKPITEDNIPQVLYYDQGIGTISKSQGGIESLFKKLGDSIQTVGGGAFGWWIDEKIEEAYLFLCLNYIPGDEIYLFGFSRGAYTIRSLVGLINCCGLLRRPDISETGEAYEIYRISDAVKRQKAAREFRQRHEDQKVAIKFLGCWDTVGALGIPDLIPLFPFDNLVNEKYRFHNSKLSSIIEHARHAIAIDEKRKVFNVTIMETEENFTGTLKQVWFPGDHGCIGGGSKEVLGLSNGALKWMAEEATELGLVLDLSLAEDTSFIDYKTSFDNQSFLEEILEGYRDINKINEQLEENFKFDLNESFHNSVKQRWCDQSLQYKPENLQEFLKGKQINWCS